MSDPGSGNRPADEADVLAEARRTARAGAKPDHDPELRSEDPELLEQAVGRGQGGEAGQEGRAAAARDDDVAAPGTRLPVTVRTRWSMPSSTTSSRTTRASARTAPR